MPVILKTIVLLTLSNIFMMFARYGHLKSLRSKPWIIAALKNKYRLFNFVCMIQWSYGFKKGSYLMITLVTVFNSP